MFCMKDGTAHWVRLWGDTEPYYPACRAEVGGCVVREIRYEQGNKLGRGGWYSGNKLLVVAIAGNDEYQDVLVACLFECFSAGMGSFRGCVPAADKDSDAAACVK